MRDRRKGQNAATFLLRDEFTTDRAAGAVNGTAAEPGPGTRSVLDTGGNLSITASKVSVTGAVPPNDPLLSYGGFARAIGRALLGSVVITVSDDYIWGWNRHLNPSSGYPDLGYSSFGPHLMCVVNGYGIVDSYDPPAGSAERWGAILRSSGGFLLETISGIWTLLWVDSANTQASLIPIVGGRDTNVDFQNDWLRVADLAAPWNTDYGIATQQLAGARSNGDTFTHEANALIEFTVATVPAAGQAELRFRIQDATNYWKVTVDSTGTLDLDEVVGGVVTNRGTAAGVIANGDRIVIICTGTTLRVFEANTLCITYAAAANFQTETDGELETEGTGGAVTDIVSWPRTLSGAALAELEKYTA